MSRPVSLSVHKTNRARRRAKIVRRDIRRFVTAAQRELGVGTAGYALVIWADDGRAVADWLNADPLKGYPVEDFARNMLSRSKTKQDVESVFGPDDDGSA